MDDVCEQCGGADCRGDCDDDAVCEGGPDCDCFAGFRPVETVTAFAELGLL